MSRSGKDFKQRAKGASGDLIRHDEAATNDDPPPQMMDACPCGHNRVSHGAMSGNNGIPLQCEIKECKCSGFGNAPNQGMGWAYQKGFEYRDGI